MSVRVEVVAGRDDLGEPEDFTWDLLPVVDPRTMVHLATDGLPRVGTHIRPGMILVGKIGKTQRFNPARTPTALELHGLPFDEIRSRYGDMWKDCSVYADPQTSGVVEETNITDFQGTRKAIVVLQRGDTEGEKET